MSLRIAAPLAVILAAVPPAIAALSALPSPAYGETVTATPAQPQTIILTPEPSGTVTLTPEPPPKITGTTEASAPIEATAKPSRAAPVEPVPSHTPAFDAVVREHAQTMFDEGRSAFRHETFGNEAFWGGALRLHEAIAGERHGGTGPGLGLRAALDLGLKVDASALSEETVESLRSGRADLEDPDVTLELLRANAVVGLTGFSDGRGGLASVGIQCALCHSSVDNSVAPGVGARLDGWANRDLDVGDLIALAPSVGPIASLLNLSEDEVRGTLRAWGPGRFDAALGLDGTRERPDGRTSAVLIPSIFGLAGVSHAPAWMAHWNAFGSNPGGTFIDSRFDDPSQFPVAASARLGHASGDPDRLTPRLPALEFYRLSLPAPAPPPGSYRADAAVRGREVFRDRARCVSCHVEGLTTEPGWNRHRGEEIGIDNFHADRNPERRYRTASLLGLWTRSKGGYYHDGRFGTLRAVVDHYESVMALGLSDEDKGDLIEYLKSLGGKVEPVVASAETLNGVTGLSSGGPVDTERWLVEVRPTPAVRGVPIRVSLRGIAAGGAPPDLTTQVVDAGGRVVVSLSEWTFEPTRAVATSVWNGRSASGAPVTPGEYSVRITSASARYQEDRKLVLR
jgi:hypothetical protein